MKIIIVGGVAGGASCAARLRRLNEKGNPFLAGMYRYSGFQASSDSLPVRS